MDLLERMQKLKEQQESQKKESPEEKKIAVQEERKISKPQKIEIMTSLEIKKESDWDNLNISQDDLWFLYRLKFGKGTRIKRSKLLPKFAEAFNRELNEMRK